MSHVGMMSTQLWGPAEDDIPDLVSDDSEDEEALVARAPRPPRPDAEALLTLGVKYLPQGLLHGITVQGRSCQLDTTTLYTQGHMLNMLLIQRNFSKHLCTLFFMPVNLNQTDRQKHGAWRLGLQL